MDAIDRSQVASLRKMLSQLGAVVAEVDADLRYVWIDNPHPDFDPEAVVGKRDDELLPAHEAEGIVTFKCQVFAEQVPASTTTLSFTRSDGTRAYTMMGYPIINSLGRMEALLTLGFETAVK